MELPVVWVWTHDSVGLGEDGPTHQPIEHYAALRAIPHLWVIRPADANETAVAWQVALEREDGPVALLLSRQNVPTLDRAEVGAAAGRRARRLRAVGVRGDARADPDRDRLRGRARARGRAGARRRERHAVRVVSMPCMELFEAQPQDYRDEVLPPDVRARLAVEAGRAHGLGEWVGDRRRRRSGSTASAPRRPGTTVLEKLGFTVDNVVARARPRARWKGRGDSMS